MYWTCPIAEGELEKEQEQSEIKHQVNGISCGVLEENILVHFVEKLVYVALADWSGVVKVSFLSCDSWNVQSAKREEQAQVTTVVYLEGPAASSAMAAVENYLASNPTSEVTPGVTATYVSSTPTSPFPGVYAYRDDGLSGGQIAGIVIGCVAFASIVLAAVVFFMMREPEGIQRE